MIFTVEEGDTQRDRKCILLVFYSHGNEQRSDTMIQNVQTYMIFTIRYLHLRNISLKIK